MNIMKYRPIFYAISFLLVAASIFSIVKWGFKTSIDFAGGSILEASFPSRPDKGKLSDLFDQQNLPLNSISLANQQNYLFKFQNITPETKVKLNEVLKKFDPAYAELRFESVGPILGKELLKKTIFAIILSSFFLLLFIGRRFKDLSFGASAIIAMFHDSFILIGSFSLLGHFFGAELDSLFVTALLTTLSASVHDTVVTFDRIRELRRQNYKIDWVHLANQAVTETIVRSVNNSMTIIFMLLSLVVLGGDTTRWFAVALLIGVICGTYSSTAVAIPLVLFWKRKSQK
jgi:preprotein translocase subunit SecF